MINNQSQNLILPTEKAINNKPVTSKKESVKFIVNESFKGTKNLSDIFTEIIFWEIDKKDIK